jgi:hypothetical protein
VSLPAESGVRHTDHHSAHQEASKVSHPGKIVDGAEEQVLDERGNPEARVKKNEVVAAFGKQRPTK